MVVAAGFSGVVGPAGLAVMASAVVVLGRLEGAASCGTSSAGRGRFLASGGAASTLVERSFLRASFADLDGRLNSSLARFAFAFFSFKVTIFEGRAGFSSSWTVRAGGAATIVFLALLDESEDCVDGWLATPLDAVGFRSLAARSSSTTGGKVGESSAGILNDFLGLSFSGFVVFPTGFFFGAAFLSVSPSNKDGWRGDKSCGRADFVVFSDLRGVDMPLSERGLDPLT
jgi:hypothetical protein